MILLKCRKHQRYTGSTLCPNEDCPACQYINKARREAEKEQGVEAVGGVWIEPLETMT